MIFPEGTRSKNSNQMLEFHSGSFKCAIKTQCPILPIALIATAVAFLIFSRDKKQDAIQIMFVIDTTGSMGDEINYLKSEVNTKLIKDNIFKNISNEEDRRVYVISGDKKLIFSHNYDEEDFKNITNENVDTCKKAMQLMQKIHN